MSAGTVRADGRLACAYHGWNFDAQGHGRSPASPGLRHCDTRAYRVVERYSYLWIADEVTPDARFPALGWDGFSFAGAFSTLFHAPLYVALDNFSEDEHFPYIHTLFGWDETGVPGVEFKAENFADRVEVCYSGPQRPSLWLPLLGVSAGDRFYNEWYTRFDPVHAVFTFRWVDARSGRERPVVARTAVFLVPETAATARFHIFLFLRIGPSAYRWIAPVIRKAALLIGRKDVERDARFIRHVAETPPDLKGFRLARFDKPVIHNRRLLRSLYWDMSDARHTTQGESEPG